MIDKEHHVPHFNIVALSAAINCKKEDTMLALNNVELCSTLPKERLPEIAEMLWKHLWGQSYTHPFVLDMASKATYLLCAVEGSVMKGKIVGCALTTRYRGFPDNYVDNRAVFGGWCIRPENRGAGIGGKLYDGCMQWERANGERAIFATTDSEEARQILHGRQKPWQNQWCFVREGVNEDRTRMKLWRLEL
jgi:GNAT superfamily N-acetyltransferase